MLSKQRSAADSSLSGFLVRAFTGFRGLSRRLSANRLSGLGGSAYLSVSCAGSAAPALHQSRNVPWNQTHGAIFAKVAQLTRNVSTKTTCLDFQIFLVSGILNEALAHRTKPTSRHGAKHTRFQTPTTSKAFLFRISNIPGMGRLGPEREYPLESVKAGLHAREAQENGANANVI